MKTQFLLPNSFKKPGVALMLIAAITYIIEKFTSLPLISGDIKIFAIFNSPGLLQTMATDPNAGFFKIISTNIGYTLFNLVFISGSLMAAFARQKTEDEYITKLRLESLMWGVYVNFIIILIANLAIYGTGFIDVLILNMYTIPVLFLLRFHYVINRTNMTVQNEK